MRIGRKKKVIDEGRVREGRVEELELQKKMKARRKRERMRKWRKSTEKGR